MSEITLNEAAWDSDDLDGAFDFLFGDDDLDFTFEDLEWESEEEYVLESDLEESEESDDYTDCGTANCIDCLVDCALSDCASA
ncbi:MAG: hypothetical protein ACK5WS_01130 [Alphaproteobacteria bacterium]|jgi:hypothetical protein|nr:hypothetical protein [Candidatus Jidaibacter sp.]